MLCSHDVGVSVVVTLYNYARFINDCMISFRQQVVNFPIEMVVVDDGSTDGGDRLVKRMLKLTGHPIRLLYMHGNFGYASAKNVGIKAAYYRYVKMLDADDMLYTNCLQECFKFLTETGNDFVHGPCIRWVKKKGNWQELGTHPQWTRWLKELGGPQPWIGVHAQGTMYRKSLHSVHGLYDTHMKSKADREMWARFYLRGVHLSSIDHPIALYRSHASQMSRSKAKRSCDQEIADYMRDAVLRRSSGDMSGIEML